MFRHVSDECQNVDTLGSSYHSSSVFRILIPHAFPVLRTHASSVS
jgi:hypothetical protein